MGVGSMGGGGGGGGGGAGGVGVSRIGGRVRKAPAILQSQRG